MLLLLLLVLLLDSLTVNDLSTICETSSCPVYVDWSGINYILREGPTMSVVAPARAQ
jgi:hypothetical protein